LLAGVAPFFTQQLLSPEVAGVPPAFVYYGEPVG